MANYVSGSPVPSVNVTWTDDPVVADTTEIKAVHIEELRTALEVLDLHYHVIDSINTGTFDYVVSAWTDDPLVANTTKIKAAHVNELIATIKLVDNHRHTYTHSCTGTGAWDANTSYYDPSMTFTDDPVVADTTEPKAAAIEELRTYLEGFATHTHTVCCNCECTCQCTCNTECSCQEQCCSQCDMGD